MKTYHTVTLAFAAFLISAFTPTSAATSLSNVKVKRLERTLKHLPLNASNPKQVINIIVRLTKLNPKKSVRYYKIGSARFAGSEALRDFYSDRLGRYMLKTLTKIGMPTHFLKRFARVAVEPTDQHWILYTPTPTPTPTP